MRKSTFVKIARQINYLNEVKKSLTKSLKNIEDELSNTLTMIIQAIEEDTEIAWEPELMTRLLQCKTNEDAEKLYDEITDTVYDFSKNTLWSFRGITLQQLRCEGVIGPLCRVLLYERKKGSVLYKEVYKGLFKDVPKKYESYIGTIPYVGEDDVDCIQIHIYNPDPEENKNELVK